MNDIRLDASKLAKLVQPIVETLVNGEDGYFDYAAIPLLLLDAPLPGIR